MLHTERKVMLSRRRTIDKGNCQTRQLVDDFLKFILAHVNGNSEKWNLTFQSFRVLSFHRRSYYFIGRDLPTLQSLVIPSGSQTFLRPFVSKESVLELSAHGIVLTVRPSAAPTSLLTLLPIPRAPFSWSGIETFSSDGFLGGVGFSFELIVLIHFMCSCKTSNNLQHT